MELQKYEEKNIRMEEIRQRLTAVLEENKSSCIEINGRLEITRPVALALLNSLSRMIASSGGSMEIRKEVLSFSPIVIKSIAILRVGDSVLHFEALGSADEGEKKGARIYHDTLATAETRSLKRLLEETVGEDFINKVLRPVIKKSNNSNYNTNNLINKVIELAKKKKIGISKVAAEVGLEVKDIKDLRMLKEEDLKKIIEKYEEVGLWK